MNVVHEIRFTHYPVYGRENHKRVMAIEAAAINKTSAPCSIGLDNVLLAPATIIGVLPLFAVLVLVLLLFAMLALGVLVVVGLAVVLVVVGGGT
jgi:hypothetical protein